MLEQIIKTLPFLVKNGYDVFIRFDKGLATALFDEVHKIHKNEITNRYYMNMVTGFSIDKKCLSIWCVYDSNTHLKNIKLSNLVVIDLRGKFNVR